MSESTGSNNPLRIAFLASASRTRRSRGNSSAAIGGLDTVSETESAPVMLNDIEDESPPIREMGNAIWDIARGTTRLVDSTTRVVVGGVSGVVRRAAGGLRRAESVQSEEDADHTAPNTPFPQPIGG